MALLPNQSDTQDKSGLLGYEVNFVNHIPQEAETSTSGDGTIEKREYLGLTPGATVGGHAAVKLGQQRDAMSSGINERLEVLVSYRDTTSDTSSTDKFWTGYAFSSPPTDGRNFLYDVANGDVLINGTVEENISPPDEETLLYIILEVNSGRQRLRIRSKASNIDVDTTYSQGNIFSNKIKPLMAVSDGGGSRGKVHWARVTYDIDT